MPGWLFPLGEVTPHATLLERVHRLDAPDNRIADLGVVDRTLDHPLAACGPNPLRLHEDRVVRLVPRNPLADPDRRRSVGELVLPRVAARRGGHERLQLGRAGRGRIPTGGRIRPRGSPDDREDHTHLVRERIANRPVVDRPVVRGIGGVRRDGRTLPCNTVRPTPPEIDPNHLRADLLEHREHLVGVAVEDLRVVVDSLLDELRRVSRGRADEGRDESCRGHDESRPTQPSCFFRATQVSDEGPHRARSRAPSRGAVGHA